jgi:hypothetical protein
MRRQLLVTLLVLFSAATVFAAEEPCVPRQNSLPAPENVLSWSVPDDPATTQLSEAALVVDWDAVPGATKYGVEVVATYNSCGSRERFDFVVLAPETSISIPIAELAGCSGKKCATVTDAQSATVRVKALNPPAKKEAQCNPFSASCTVDFCGDLVDGDCDAQIDEDCDRDGDGYLAGDGIGSCGAGNDCDDNNADVHPGRADYGCPGDGIDNDCDGAIDEEGCPVTIVKRTNGYDADEAPGPLLITGSTVTWTYVVTNFAVVPLTNVRVTDDRGVTVGCPENSLAAGASMTCNATGMAVSGPYANTGTAAGKLPWGETVTASDVSHYFGATPLIDIEMRINGQEAGVPPYPSIPAGTSIQFTCNVTNTGDVGLTAVGIAASPLTFACPKSELQPGESMTCTNTTIAAAGPHTFTAEASGSPAEGPAVNASDSAGYMGTVPSISIVKLTNGFHNDVGPGPSIDFGDPVTWTYIVTNIGEFPLTNVSVTDDRGVVVTCPKTTLQAAESMTCTGSGTAVEGNYSNIGTVTGTMPDSSTVIASHPAYYHGETHPYLDMFSLDMNRDSASAWPPGPSILIGDPLDWRLALANLGDVLLQNISVTTNLQGVTVVCPKTALESLENMTCSAQSTVVRGLQMVEWWVDAATPGGHGASTYGRGYYTGVLPSISIETLTNDEDADTPPGPAVLAGSSVVWRYLVTNTGDVSLTNVAVTDNRGVAVTCPKTTLEPAESMTCTASATARIGQYANIGTVNATSSVGPTVTASDPSHYMGIGQARIAIEVHTNGEDADTPPGPAIPAGTTVTWTYMVANIGDQSLTNVAVTDNQGVAVSCPLNTLAPGESMTCAASGAAISGQYANIGIATATPEIGPQVTASDPSHYFGEP